MKPYSFEATIPTEAMIDLGQRLVSGKRGLPELKDAVGIAGCILEKYDGDDASLIALAVDANDATLEELGEQLQAQAAVEGQTAEALNLAILLPLILRIIELIVSFRRNGGDSGGPV